MPRQIMMSAMPTVVDYVGEPVRAAGWYGPTAGLHTISIKTLNFRGTLLIEGTLAVTPSETDWFPIVLGGQTSLSFPLSGTMPTYGAGYIGESITLGYNFISNCLFLRARALRSDLIPSFATFDQIAIYGQVDLIVVQY